MKKLLLRSATLFMLIAFSFAANTASSQVTNDYRSTGGNWGTLASWQRYNGTAWVTPSSLEGYPGQFNTPGTVTILTGDVITLNVSPANNLGFLILEAGANASTLTFSGAFNLTTSDITINSSTNNTDKTIAVGTGTLTCSSITMAATGSNFRSDIVTVSTGTINVLGNITMNDTGARNFVTISSTGTLNISGNITSGALNTSNVNSTVNYNGTNQNIYTTTYAGKLTCSNSGTKTLLGTTDVNGTLTVSAGTTLALSTFNITPTATVLECAAVTGSIISGTGSLSLVGNVTVNAVNTGTSGASITAPVALNATRTFNVADDGTAAADLTVSAVISTAFGLTKTGAGKMVLDAVNTYSGTTTVTDGILLYNNNNAIAAGAVTVNGGTLDLATFTDAVGTVTLTSGTIASSTGVLTGTSYAVQNGSISAILAGAVNLTKTTTGTVTLSGTNTYTGITTISSGVLSVATIGNGGSAGNLGAATSTATNLVLGGGTLQYTGALASTNRNFVLNAATTSTIDVTTNDLTWAGASTATTGGLTKIGNGTLILTGTNLYTGTTTVGDRTLRYGVNNALATGPVVVDGGILDLVTFTDAVGAVTLVDGQINSTSGILTGTSYSVQNGTITAILAGAVNLSKTTTGTVVMSGVNTYTGITTISAGVLSVSNIGNGGVASNIGAAAVTATNLVFGNGTLRYTGANATTNRNFVINAATTTVIEVTTNTLTLSGASTATSGALTKDGNGTLVLSGSNLYTGTTNITAGTLALGASERISNSSNLIVDATFDMAGFSETVASFSGGGNVTSSASGNLILAVSSTASTNFTGTIVNGSATSIALSKAGTGILALSGSNTYTGRTTITAGTILIDAAYAIPASPVTMAGGTLSTGNSGGYSETIGDLTVSSNSTIALGSGSHTLTIANSSANTWAATTLTITGWTGTGGSGGAGTQGIIMVGVGGLTSGQLSKINFTAVPATGAAITPSGELVPASGGTIYYSKGSLAPNLTTSWTTLRNGTGTTPTAFTLGYNFIIQDTHTMTTSAAWSVSGSGSKVEIESGGTLVANNNITLNAATTFQVDDGGTYTHNNASTASTNIFAGTESFAPTSTVNITNWATTSVITTGVTLPFGNLNISYNPGATWSQTWGGSLNLAAGNVSIDLGIATRQLRMTATTTASPDLILDIGGSFTVGTGTIVIVGGGTNGNKVATLNVGGDLNINTSGTLEMNGTTTTTGSIDMNVSGNVAITGTGVLQSTNTNGPRIFNFTKPSGVQTFTSTAGGINSDAITFNVGTGFISNTLQLLSNFVMANAGALNITNLSTLDCGTNIVQATVANTQGNFNLMNGATIKIGSTGGIAATGATGNIQTATTRIFDATDTYIYNGVSAQVSGTAMTNAGILEIANAAGVTLSTNAAVSTTLKLTSGNLTTGANVLSVTNNFTGAITRVSGQVIGNLKRAIATGTNTYSYPVGTTSGYTPASLAMTGVSGAGNITVASLNGVSANYPSGTGLSATKRLNRYWVVTNGGVSGFTTNATFTYLAGDLGGGVTAGQLKAYRADPGPTLTYPISSDYSFAGTTYNYNNITSFSSTANFTEFGAGACGLAPTFTKTYASSCGGGSDGTITVTAAGGTTPYTYSWTSTPSGYTASTAAITGLAPMDYTVVVSDASGCTASIPNITILLVQPPTFTYNATNTGSCNNSGTITMYGIHGVQPYQYSVDGTNYFVSNSFTGLAAATYTGYIRDLRGCIGTQTIIIGAAPTLSVTSFTRPSSGCTNSGTIELYRAGGIGPYTFSINGSTYQSSFSFSNVAPGTYTGYLKDSKNCIATVTGVVVTQAAALVAGYGKTNTSSCLNDGTIQIKPTGGTPAYTYSLNDVTYQSSASFTGLAAGNYTGWVKDARGCKSSVAITIAGNPIVVTAAVVNASGCANNGSIQLYQTGGTAPYTYSLNNVTYVGTSLFTGLAPGSYTGWVKDSKGCIASLPITVGQPATLTATYHTTKASTCVNDGTIQLQGVGGVAPYTYSLDDVTYGGSSFTGLAAGSYTGWVKGANGCKASVSITVAGDVIVVSSNTLPSSTCVNNGSFSLFGTGGTAPYTFSMDNVTYGGSNSFTGLSAGNYTGWIKDSKGCVASSAVTVGQQSAISATAGKTDPSSCVNDGTIQLQGNGGVAPYTYSLDDVTYVSGSSFGGLAAGSYTGWAKGADGCKASVMITLSTNAISVTAYPSAASSCAASDGKIQLFRTGGVSPATFSLDGITYQSSNVFTGLTAGTYDGYAKDAQGCVGVLMGITVGPTCPTPPVTATTKTTNAAAKVNSDNSGISVTAYPNPSADAFTLAIQSAGQDKVTVTVMDISGRKLKQSTINAKQLYRFGSDLKAGIYFVQVEMAGKKQTIKLVKK